MRLLIIFLISFITASCSGGRIGYYVAVWPPEEAGVKSGETAYVISQSDIRDVYVIENKSDKKREEVPRTSGKFFKKKKEAENFREKYSQFIDQYGYSEKSLIIRTSPSGSSGREYKLRPSQIVKIVDRLPGPVTVGKLSGYWYQVLTEDGFEGYCFDKYLTVYEKSSKKLTEDNAKDYIERFLGNIWYPAVYLETLKSGQVVVEKLRTGEGVFPDKEGKKIIIQTSEERIAFNYENIISSGNDSFVLSGTPVEIIFYSDDKIYIKYVNKGIDYSRFYTLLENPVDHYIELELARRDNELDSFFRRGKYLVSGLYGSITLRDDDRFIWTGYINLVPEIIPFGFGNSGYLKNKYFISGNLSGDFDGTLSFVFDRSGREINFAYLFKEEGVQFTFIPEDSIENGVVVNLPEERFVYYFKQTSLLEEG
ncbi:MAG: SH3 domain-containing protein [Spirochaetia bacterium]|nr:SH3 domain-containing protein [Spirochaetia bacterium]